MTNKNEKLKIDSKFPRMAEICPGAFIGGFVGSALNINFSMIIISSLVAYFACKVLAYIYLLLKVANLTTKKSYKENDEGAAEYYLFGTLFKYEWSTEGKTEPFADKEDIRKWEEEKLEELFTNPDKLDNFLHEYAGKFNQKEAEIVAEYMNKYADTSNIENIITKEKMNLKEIEEAINENDKEEG